MQIFTLNKTTYTDGKLINGLKSISWVERFKEAGEFSFTAYPSTDLLEDLALGTLVSHDKTLEVMVVENQEIVQSEDGEHILTISGRSAEAFLFENRLMLTTEGTGYSRYLMVLDYTPWDYVLSWDRPWNQALKMINRHAVDVNLYGAPYHSEWEIPNASVNNYVSTSNYPSPEIVPAYEERGGSLQSVYQELLNLMNVGDFGLKCERPGAFHSTTLEFVIHRGVDLRNSVQFSHDEGDLISARYFWSVKNKKNATWAYTDHYGRYHRMTSATGWDHLETATDATSWKLDYRETKTELITNGHYDRVVSLLTTRATNDLASKQGYAIIDAQIKPSSKYTYVVDYGVGDLVYVDGDYGTSAVMRVTEVARTIDETGEKCFPTLQQTSALDPSIIDED